MSGLIERIAEAMAQPCDWDRFSPRARNAYRLMARACLTELLDPTDAMVEAGDRAAQASSRDHFRAMIRAALDEDPEP